MRKQLTTEDQAERGWETARSSREKAHVRSSSKRDRKKKSSPRPAGARLPPCPLTGAGRQMDPHARKKTKKTYSGESHQKESSAGSPGGKGPACHTGGRCRARARWPPPPAPQRRRRRRRSPPRPSPSTWPCGWRGGGLTACPWRAARHGTAESSGWGEERRGKAGRGNREGGGAAAASVCSGGGGAGNSVCVGASVDKGSRWRRQWHGKWARKRWRCEVCGLRSEAFAAAWSWRQFEPLSGRGGVGRWLLMQFEATVVWWRSA